MEAFKDTLPMVCKKALKNKSKLKISSGFKGKLITRGVI